MESSEFLQKFKEKEKYRGCFIVVVQGSFGNKAGNYMELVEVLVKSCGEMGYRMSLKVHFRDIHLNNFKENMGAYSVDKDIISTKI